MNAREQAEHLLAALERMLASGLSDSEGKSDRPLSSEGREMVERQTAVLRSNLSDPKFFLPARGMSAKEAIDFTQQPHVPELPAGFEFQATQFLLAQDFFGYLLLFDSHLRLVPFLALQSRLNDTDYWRTLADIWTSSEWSADLRELWDWLFFQNRDTSEALAMMGESERQRWDDLPPEFTIYRGQQRKTDPVGLAWTLSRNRAEWFASRERVRFAAGWTKGPGVVLVGKVSKRDALAYLDHRGEQEVLVPADKVREIRFEDARS